MIVRAGVGVNFREPPDEIGRVGISAFGERLTFYSTRLRLVE